MKYGLDLPANLPGQFSLSRAAFFALGSSNSEGAKGQIISKRFFSGQGFAQKTNENTSHTSKNEFIRSFFGRILGLSNFLGCAKGQLFSKWFLGIVDFLQKTNENKSHSSKVEFIRCFLEEIDDPKNHFEIN